MEGAPKQEKSKERIFNEALEPLLKELRNSSVIANIADKLNLLNLDSSENEPVVKALGGECNKEILEALEKDPAYQLYLALHKKLK